MYLVTELQVVDVDGAGNGQCGVPGIDQGGLAVRWEKRWDPSAYGVRQKRIDASSRHG